MRLKFLGTAAAEGVPAVFCNCDNCIAARKRGGKNIRTRSQILIDDDILFDFPMDTYMHALTYGLDLSAVKIVLITHSHMDHCYPQEFIMRGGPFAHALSQKTVEIICNKTVKDIFIADTAREIRPEVMENIVLTEAAPFSAFNRGDTAIIALPAVHTKGEDCLVYYVSRGGKGALMLNDTGLIDGSVFERLKSMGAHADIVTFDCTYGDMEHGPGRHMGLIDAAATAALLKRIGIIDDGAKLVCTHFSHNVPLSHEELFERTAARGFVAACDGMEIAL